MPGRKYTYNSEAPPHTKAYLLPSVESVLKTHEWSRDARALDFGCGNGWLTQWLHQSGFTAVGVDISQTGIAIAMNAYPASTFSNDISAESLQKLGPFDLAICIETIAHCHDAADELAKIYNVLKPQGVLILSTPYHGYWKNLLLAISGRLDKHLTDLWSGGYVRFFSRLTITSLLRRAGFSNVAVRRVGRIPPLAKSMVVTAIKPI